MSRCTNCGTSEGPFVRDRDLPGHPVCGFPSRYKATPELRGRRIHDCLARRDALDAKKP